MRTERFLIAFAAVAASAGCANRPAPVPAVVPAAVPAVGTVKPQMRPVRRVVEQPGTVQAFEETVLYAKFPGYVQTIAADPAKASAAPHDRAIDIGSRVAKGQVLVELAIPELDEELKQKEAVVRQGQAEVTQATKALHASVAGVTAAAAAVGEAKAGLIRAQALYDRWQSETARVGRMVSGGVIDAQTRDETQNQFRAAEASRAEAHAKVSSAEAGVAKAEADRDKAAADVAAAEAKLDVARADVRRLEALRGYAKLWAPFDGVVTRRATNTGDFVMAGGKQGLFAVARIDPVRVVVSVPEADAGLVSPGLEVQITLQATGPVQTGKVTRTSWSLEPTSRTLRTEIDLPNPEGKVRPGMYVYARLIAELPAAWSVPAAAIGRVSDEPVLYLVEGGKAVRVAVQLGRGDGQFTQVRRYKRPGSSDWVDFSGGESVASPAAAVADGQPLG